MAVLYRCRTSLAEVADTFSAVRPASAVWSGEMWQGRTGLVVTARGGAREVRAMRWGLPALGERPGRASKREPTAVFFREIWPGNRHWLAPEHRCLIVAEAFAYPDRTCPSPTRTWFGLEDRPIFAWAGLCDPDAGRFCGFLVSANECVAPHSTMPAIVAPGDIGTWLEGDLAAAGRVARTICPAQAMYWEPTEEPWGGEREP